MDAPGATTRPKSAPVEGQHELFGFLTTEPNTVVAPIHPKAMPVILTTPAEVDLWLAADAMALPLLRGRDAVLFLPARDENGRRLASTARPTGRMAGSFIFGRQQVRWLRFVGARSGHGDKLSLPCCVLEPTSWILASSAWMAQRMRSGTLSSIFDLRPRSAGPLFRCDSVPIFSIKPKLFTQTGVLSL
jgi:hypothetical protein